jgi:hypothetical protein
MQEPLQKNKLENKNYMKKLIEAKNVLGLLRASNLDVFYQDLIKFK